MNPVWRAHPRLRGRFHADYPDDVQVIVHDGGPRLTDRQPELVWVRIAECAADVFSGVVLNQPQQLRSVALGARIRFVVPDGSEYPLAVSDKYLAERRAWRIDPCERCGLTELFDAPSDLLRATFPSAPPGAVVEMLTTRCGLCGGTQILELTREG